MHRTVLAGARDLDPLDVVGLLHDLVPAVVCGEAVTVAAQGGDADTSGREHFHSSHQPQVVARECVGVTDPHAKEDCTHLFGKKKPEAKAIDDPDRHRCSPL